MSTGYNLELTFELVRLKDVDEYIVLRQLVAIPPWYLPVTSREDANVWILASKVFFVSEHSMRVGLAAYTVRDYHTVHITEVGVIPSERRRGIGRAITVHLMDEIRCFPKVELMVHIDNPARKIYESIGFKVTKEVPNFYGDGETRLVMAFER